MEVLNKFFKASPSGKIYKYSEKSAVVLEIFNFSNISNVILPFFEKYPIKGVKQLDYLDWCKVAKLMNNNNHLTDEGLALIRSIKEGMNKGRLKK
jgi:hypothetical protein